MPTASWLQLAVGIVMLALAWVAWKQNKSVKIQAQQDAKDKEIDAATDADDIIRASGGM